MQAVTRVPDVLFATALGGMPMDIAAWRRAGGYIAKDENICRSVTRWLA
jgi:hypothetical protein